MASLLGLSALSQAVSDFGSPGSVSCRSYMLFDYRILVAA
jgi:hypothetical protein